MNRVTLLAFLLLPLPALATPELSPPEEGVYSFNGSFEVRQKIHYEIAHAFTDAGKMKLALLRKKGFECWHKMRGTWLCKKFQAPEGSEALLKSRVEAAFEAKALDLGTRFGEPSLISKGTEVAEYKVIQPASYGGKTWKDYRLVMNQGHWSIRMGEPVELQFSLDPANKDQLLKWQNFPVTESRDAYSVYLVKALFSKN